MAEDTWKNDMGVLLDQIAVAREVISKFDHQWDEGALILKASVNDTVDGEKKNTDSLRRAVTLLTGLKALPDHLSKGSAQKAKIALDITVANKPFSQWATQGAAKEVDVSLAKDDMIAALNAVESLVRSMYAADFHGRD